MKDEGGEETRVDQGQFLEEFTRHSRRLYGYILSLTLNRDDADDVYQKTSIVLYKKYAEFKPRQATFYTWACRVAYLEVLYFRRTQRKTNLLSEQALELLRDEALRCSDDLERREEALVDCLKKLGAPERTLIEERYYNNLAPKQIAEQLGKSTYSIYRALTRVHSMLRRCIDTKLAQGG